MKENNVIAEKDDTVISHPCCVILQFIALFRVLHHFCKKSGDSIFIVLFFFKLSLNLIENS